MAGPRRQFLLTLVYFLLAVGALVIAGLMPDQGKGFTLQLVLGMTGLTGGVMLFVLLFMRLVALIEHNRMQRGENVLARWTVSAELWREFVAREPARRDQRRSSNAIDLKQPVPADGVEVVMGNNAVRVGESFHPVEKHAAIAIEEDDISGVAPAPTSAPTDATQWVRLRWIEFDQVIHDPNGSDGRLVVRFPIAPGADGTAASAVRRFHDGYPKVVPYSRWNIYIAVGILVVGLGAVLALIIANRPPRSESVPDAEMPPERASP